MCSAGFNPAYSTFNPFDSRPFIDWFGQVEVLQVMCILAEEILSSRLLESLVVIFIAIIFWSCHACSQHPSTASCLGELSHFADPSMMGFLVVYLHQDWWLWITAVLLLRQLRSILCHLVGLIALLKSQNWHFMHFHWRPSLDISYLIWREIQNIIIINRTVDLFVCC